MRINKPYLLVFLASLYLVIEIYTLYIISQIDVYELWAAVAALSLLAYGLYRCSFRMGDGHQKYTTSLFVLTRVVAVFAFPLLSDDVFRFFWDGQLWLYGHNPYHHLPSALAEMFKNDPPMLMAFASMNSPEYSTVYPPMSQLGFMLVSLIADSVASFSIGLGAIIALADYYIFIVLKRWAKKLNLSSSIAILFAFHPLVLIEGVGNLHFEIVMLALLFKGVDLLIQAQNDNKINLILGGAFMALSVLTKLHTLIIIPFILLSLQWRAGRTVIVTFFLTMLLGFLPVLLGSIELPIINSLNLYFQNFEFNASIYFVLRWIGELVSGYNRIALIGPVLAVIAAVIIAMLIRNYDKWVTTTQLHQELLLLKAVQWGGISLCIFYAFSTTVHPWYLILPLGALIINRPIWLIAWGVLAFLSYARYVAVHETFFYYASITVEYVLVCLLILLYYKGLQKDRPHPSSF